MTIVFVYNIKSNKVYIYITKNNHSCGLTTFAVEALDISLVLEVPIFTPKFLKVQSHSCLQCYFETSFYNPIVKESAYSLECTQKKWVYIINVL